MVKHPPTMQETRVRSLGREDPLEKEMATHSSTLAWKIPWTEEPGKLQPMGLQRVGHDWAASLSLWMNAYDGKNEWVAHVNEVEVENFENYLLTVFDVFVL